MRSRFSPFPLLVGSLTCLLLFLAGLVQAQNTTLSITPISWNVVGLDHNKPTTDGPDTFIIGARVLNTGANTANDVTVDWTWTSANANINTAGLTTQTRTALAPGAHQDFYFTVVVTRTAAAFSTARRYVITAQGTNTTAVSTPAPREIYVEALRSQSRNETTGFSGPLKVYVGQTVEYVVDSKTAPGGYEQLVSSVTFPNTIFRFNSTGVAYTTPVGGTGTKLYADACGWNPVPGTANYLDCVNVAPFLEEYAGGKAGDTLATTYNLTIMNAGVANVNNIIYDKSGASYHYNADFSTPGISAFTIIAVFPAVVTGTIFHDVNGNGVLDLGEPRLQGVSVAVTGSDNIPVIAVTDINGEYTASLFASGNTSIAVDAMTVPPGMVLTTNNAPQNVTAVDGATTVATPIGYQQQSPIMTFSKTASASVVGSGSTFTYTLGFSNTAPASDLSYATNVVITDTLPRLVSWGDQVTFLGGTFSAGYTGSIVNNNGVLTISINENVLSGDSGSVTLTVKTVNPVPVQSIFNTATLNAQNYLNTPITPIVRNASVDTQPLMVDLEAIGVRLHNGQLILDWRTAAEYGTAGFDIYRVTAGGGAPVQINESIISAEGSPIEGATYSFADPAAYDGSAAVGYLLVETEFSGERNTYGPAWYPANPVASSQTEVENWELF